MFIMAAERDRATDVGKSFRAYQQYLTANARCFPQSAFTLATSSWYYDASDHRCPHDGWLEELRIEEPATGERLAQRIITFRVRLLGAFHDGHIDLYYPRVFGYQLALESGEGGHRDWRYDEFRVNDKGHLLHEIEWAGPRATGRWLIEASDVELVWRPFQTNDSITGA